MPISDSITPHGGELVNRWVVGEEALALAERALTLPIIRLKPKQAVDLEMLAVGAYSPLAGFMGRADYLGVLEELRLASGLPWPLPITLDVPAEEATAASEGQTVALVDECGLALGVLEVTERYRFNKESEALATLGTVDGAHPGVAEIFAADDTLLAGPVRLFRRPHYEAFAHYRHDPVETRRLFVTKRWLNIAGTRLRYPMSRADEYLQKCVLETVDGLFLHAPAPATLDGNPFAYSHISAAESILGSYYPSDQTMIAVLPAAFRTTSTRGLLLEAIVSQNYGCTHFLIRDEEVTSAETVLHGERRRRRRPGSRGDANALFARFSREELAITPLFLTVAFYCRACGTMATTKTCPHETVHHVICPRFDWQNDAQHAAVSSPQCYRPEVTRVLLATTPKSQPHAAAQPPQQEPPDSPRSLAVH